MREATNAEKVEDIRESLRRALKSLDPELKAKDGSYIRDHVEDAYNQTKYIREYSKKVYLVLEKEPVRGKDYWGNELPEGKVLGVFFSKEAAEKYVSQIPDPRKQSVFIESMSVVHDGDGILD